MVVEVVVGVVVGVVVPVAEPDAAGVALDDVELVAAAGVAAFASFALFAADSLLSADLLAVAPGLAPLFLKSVTYQPDPLSWNPAAVTCLA